MRPGAPEAGLHLVDDQQGTAGAAQRGGGGEVAGTSGAHAALALHHLQDHRGGILADRGVQGVDPVVGHVGEAGDQGEEGLAVVGLPGGGESAHGAAMEAALGGHDACPPCRQRGRT